ncbi:hypothetical protein C3B61_15460 [Cryobacterium zongtaii]|uniref:Uncharacterized protein n=2 Tax=Cryobacterium zongtaii TaxID=1259217 RepID=A0A2S3Z9R4_9MICO|nr:hypothetical protein C3B61_15460 [Cryobacterium zongtaii]
MMVFHQTANIGQVIVIVMTARAQAWNHANLTQVSSLASLGYALTGLQSSTAASRIPSQYALAVAPLSWSWLRVPYSAAPLDFPPLLLWP